MNDSQQLRESMWDLVYGLLSDEESQALIARIKSDPAAARLYSEVRLKADLIGQAAQVADNSLVLNAETTLRPSASKTERNSDAAETSNRRRRSTISKRVGTWLAGIGSIALAALLAVGLIWTRPSERQLAAAFVAADVVGQPSMQAGLTNKLELRTYAVATNGQAADPASTEVEFRLIDQTGKERLRRAVRTNDAGRASVELPGEALEPGIRMEIAETTEDKGGERVESRGRQAASLTALLPVEPEPQFGYFLQAEPTTDAAKAVPVAVWNFSAFSAKPTSIEHVELTKESLDESRQGQQLALAETVKQAAGPAVQLRTAGKAEEAVNGFKDAAGGLPLAQAAATPTIAANEPITVNIPQDLVDKPVNVAAVSRGVTVATASNGDDKLQAVNVADKRAQSKLTQLALDVPPEADGVIELEVFDRSTGDAAPAARQFVYRQPSRKLQIDLQQAQVRFAPGQEVELDVRVSDETGRPAANALVGVRVWNEQLANRATEQPLLITDAVRGQATVLLAKNVAAQQQAQSFELAQSHLNRFRRSEEADRNAAPLQPAPANEPLTQGVQAQDQRQLSEPAAAYSEPVVLATNRDAVMASMRQAVAQSDAARKRTRNAIGMTAVVGSVAFLVAMGALALLQMAASLRVMTPAILLAVASLFIGLLWVEWPSSRKFGQIAMAPVATSAAESADAAALPARSSLGDDVAAARPSASGEPTDLLTATPPSASATAPAEAKTAAGTEAAAPAAPALVAGDERGVREGLSESQELGRLRESERLVADGKGVVKQQPGVAPSSSPSQPRGGAAAPIAGITLAEQQAQSSALGTTPRAGLAGGFGAGRAIAAAGGVPAAKSDTESKVAAKELRAEGTDAKSANAKDAPAALYFNPQLTTDEEGRAKIRFVMPPVESQYRLMIDALGNNRIGARQDILVCSPDLPAAAAKPSPP